MAKKAVATFSAKSGAKSMVKCIRMDKSPKTGAYMFKEELIEADKVKDFFAKKAVNSNKNIIFTPQSILNLSKKEYHYG